MNTHSIQATRATLLTALENREPARVARWLLYVLLIAVLSLFLWAVFGRLDIVAVAQGKLVPATYVKIVQPADAGIVKDILVKEGQAVKAGQVLMRMDAAFGQADQAALLADYHLKDLAVRRIDAELSGRDFVRESDDPDVAYAQALAQLHSNRLALESALAEERSVLEKARHDLAAAEQVKMKLTEMLPHYRSQEAAYDNLAKQGYMGKLMADEKARDRIEQEQNLRTQDSLILAARADITRSERRAAQLRADHQMRLRAERQLAVSDLEKLRQELAKQQKRVELMALKAPQDGIVKDLATHTSGTVVSPGTILMTLVPSHESLRAEVWIKNDDIGFVHPGQSAKLKLGAFQFTKYGMVEGKVDHVGADAADHDEAPGTENPPGQLLYRALIALNADHLAIDGHRYPLSAGMQAAAEVNLGTRSVLEYLLSPIQKAFHEAGRER
jgi:hemolysin D